MKKHTLIVEVMQSRVYTIESDSADEAEDLVREEAEFLPYEILDSEIQNVTVEE